MHQALLPARSRLVLTCAALALTALAAHSSEAVANGRPPATFQVHAGPPTGDDLLVGSSFGLAFSSDQGASWQWACEQAMQPEPFADPSIVWRDDGTILQSTGSLLVSRDRACSWERHPDFLGGGVLFVGADPNDDSILFVGTGQTGGTDGIHRSTDGGTSFSITNAARSGAFFNAVAVAASDPQRVYGSAFDLGSTPFLYRSTDGGETFEELRLTAPSPGAFRLLGVSPVDPDTAFVVFIGRPTNTVQRTTDGGDTFATVLAADEDVRQVALSDDGQTVWLSTSAGVYRSTDAGETFTRLAQPENNGCVARLGSTLYVCGDPNVDPWALATSTDGGDTFTAAMTFDSLTGPIECPDDSPTAITCNPRWEDERKAIASTWGIDLPDDGAGDDCECSSVRAQADASLPASPLWTALAAFLIMTIVIRRRRTNPARHGETR